MKKRILIIVAIVLVVAGVVVGGLMWRNRANNTAGSTQTVTNTQSPTTSITYKGQNGVTALDLLQKAAKVEMTGTGDMAYVTSINGTTADAAKKQYWEFDVNGAAATVGAGSYVSKDSDTITWKLSTY